MGSYDTSHVEKYRGVANIVIVEWDQAAEWQTREGRLRHNCTVNAIRALRHGNDYSCVCCEDDIMFNPDWYSQLTATIAEIERQDYVLNLGQDTDPPSVKRYTTHTNSYLCGAQGIFYPSRKVREAVAEYLLQNIRAALSDHLIGQYGKEFAALYNTTPALLSHIGQVSSFFQTRRGRRPSERR